MQLQVIATAILVALSCIVFRVPRVPAVIVTCVAGALMALPGLKSLIQSLRHPTIVDVGPGGIDLTLPNRKRVFLPNREIVDIRAAGPRWRLGVGRRVSSVIITGTGQEFRILKRRDYVEARWLAREIRRASGRPADHAGEPPLRSKDNVREVSGAERPALTDLPPVRVGSATANRSWRRAFTAFLDREYNNLGCAAGLCLFLLAVAGLFITGHLVGIIIICLEFGRDSYFRQHLWFRPHRKFALSDGRMIAPEYQALFMALWMLLTAFWCALSLLSVLAIKRAGAFLGGRARRYQGTARGDRRRVRD